MGEVIHESPCVSGQDAEEIYQALVRASRDPLHDAEACKFCPILEAEIDSLAKACEARGCTEAACIFETGGVRA